MEKINNFLAVNLKFLRKKNKLSQTEFAKLISKKTSVISAYEKSITTPPIEVMLKIGEVMSTPISDLINFDLSLKKNIEDKDDLKNDLITFKTQKEKDLIGDGSEKHNMIMIISNYIYEIETTKEVINKIAETYSYNNITRNYEKAIKRYKSIDLDREFSAIHSKNMTRLHLDTFLEMSETCYFEILKDLKTLTYVAYIMSKKQ